VFEKTVRILLLCAVAGCASPTKETVAWLEPSATPRSDKETSERAEPALSEKPSLRALLHVALERNPRIHAARERALASTELSAIGRSLPDPQIMLGWYETPVETRVGPQEASFGVQQRIPWPSKLSARADLGRTTAQREVVAYERVARDVLVETAQTAYEIAYLDEAIEIAAGIAPLLERYTAAAARDDTGSALSELFRAETQRAQLDNDRVLLAELRAAEEEHLRALLDLSVGAPVGTPLVAVPPLEETGFEELLALAQAHNQELKEAGIAVEEAALRTSLARKDRLPDFTLGYMRIFTGSVETVVPLPDNGKDAQIFSLGLSVPLWANKNSARIRNARALERAAIQEHLQARLSLRSRLARVWFRVGNAQRLARLYGEVLVPRAQRSARTAEDLLAAGKGTLAGNVETIAVLHNFRLAAARARADYGQAVADLEAVLGRPLTLSPEGSKQ
jgi:outer membrane protein TolC